MNEITLTLAGPVVTRSVTWTQLDAWLLANGWESIPYDGGLGWRHPTLSKTAGDNLHTGGKYGTRPGAPAPYGVDHIALCFECLARLYGCSPGEILSRVAAGG